MKKAFGIISGAASAIVAIVKLIGTLSGNDWLGDNWQTLVGSIAVVHYALTGAFFAFGVINPIPLLEIPVTEEIRADRKFLNRMRGVYGTQALCCFAMVGFLFWIGVDTLWPIGLASLGIGIATGGWYGVKWFRKYRREHTKCRFCLETIHVQATRCKHCHGDWSQTEPTCHASK